MKTAKTVLSVGIVMVTVFWDLQGVIYIDFLESGKTVAALYYRCTEFWVEWQGYVNLQKTYF